MKEDIRYIEGLKPTQCKPLSDKFIGYYFAQSELGVIVRGKTLDGVCRYAVRYFDCILDVGRV